MVKKRKVRETLFDPLGFCMTYEGEVPFSGQSEYQDLLVLNHPFFGHMLFLGERECVATQITTCDWFIYAEMMAHVPLFAHGAAKRVLVIGGGDCSIAMEVLKHSSVEKVVQVEIDGAVVDVCKKYFPQFTGRAFADSRFTCIIGDGAQYVADTAEKFDVIIVDSSDPQEGSSNKLFGRRFYASCKDRLTENGILVTMSEVPFVQPKTLTSTIRSFYELFAYSECYLVAVPTYVGGDLAIGWASKADDISLISAFTLEQRYRAAGSFRTQYWTPAVQHAAFTLPRFIEEIVKKARY